MRRLLQYIMRYFLSVLFVTYMASIAFFAHVHVVNGVTIVHSHPFKKGSPHQHTTVELLLIHFLSNLTTDGECGTTFLLLFSPVLLCVFSGFLQYKRYYSPYHGVVSLRAPPVVRFG